MQRSEAKLGSDVSDLVKLIEAATYDNPDIIEKILAKRIIEVDQRYPDDNGSTALHFAAISNSLDAAEKLINCKAV